MHPEANPPEEVTPLKDQAPEQAAAALAEIQARRLQGAQEVARTVWRWPALAGSVLVSGAIAQLVATVALPLLAIFFLGIVIWGRYGGRAGDKRNRVALPRGARYLSNVALYLALLLFLGLRDSLEWRYSSVAAGVVTAALLALTGPLIRRAITAASVRGRS